MRKLARAILAMSLVIPVAAMGATVAYADLMTADIQTPVVETDIQIPASETIFGGPSEVAQAVAIALMGHAKTAFLQTPGWTCLQPSWNPTASGAGSRIVTLTPRIWALEAEGRFEMALELAFAAPGGRREAVTARIGRTYAELPFASVTDPIDRAELESIFITGIDIWLQEALNELRDRGVKPCEFKVKINGRHFTLVTGPVGGGQGTLTHTKAWRSDTAQTEQIVEDGRVHGQAVTVVARDTANGRSSNPGPPSITYDCLQSESNNELIEFEATYNDSDQTLSITRLVGQDRESQMRGECVMRIPALGREQTTPWIDQLPLRSPPILVAGSTVSIPFRDGASVQVPRPPGLPAADEWEMTIELEYDRR